jgi:hypothetical protein
MTDCKRAAADYSYAPVSLARNKARLGDNLDGSMSTGSAVAQYQFLKKSFKNK